MSWLLATHSLLWWFSNDARLSTQARAVIADEKNAIFVSVASAWEIATKTRIGKLDSIPDAAARYLDLVAADGFMHLPIQPLHALRAGAYPNAHRDPFDRILAAQSEIEGLTLVTNDQAFSQFGCRTLW